MNASFTILTTACITFAGQYGGMAFFGIPLIPNLIWEWLVGLVLPYLNVPPIPFEEWGLLGTTEE